MKKLLAVVCCVLYAHSFSKAPIDSGASKNADAKVLIKAIVGIMNPEGNKKAPVRTVSVYSSESL
jgi:hypothetical protein